MMRKPSTAGEIEEFGRGVPNFSSLEFEKTMSVPQVVLDSVLSGNKSGVLRGLHVVMTVKKLPCHLADTVSYQYSLVFANKPMGPVATIRTEELSCRDDKNRTKLFAISVVDVSKLKGGIESKSTHVLAAALGDYKGKQLRLLANAMPSDTTMDVKLMYDAEMEERGMYSFMEFGMAIEKQLNPYETRVQGAKIKLSSAL